MRRVLMPPAEASLRLEASTNGLANRVPGVSARRVLSFGQLIGIVLLFGLFFVILVASPVLAVTIFVSFVTVLYVIAIIYRTYLYLRSTRSDVVEKISDEEARAFPEAELPFYTVMIPAYREAAIIQHLVENISRIDYPIDRLEVLLLVEEDDTETMTQLMQSDPGPQFCVIPVPAAEPRTKPKALNYGLTLARGDLVAVFDAEDEPDPLQLRRAAIAMSRLSSDTACVQAKLSYNNTGQNIITKWFTLEYAMWFTYFLPGLASMDAPIPLGGTSNHFRREALRSLGGWDPYNVTEDADLGIRMFREGFNVRVLESTTYEEANSDFVNWIKQRSRWFKGYLQTFFIHMRHPLELVDEMGWKGVAHFAIFVGGTPTLALLNPIFWLLTILWFIAHPHFLISVFPAPIYYLGLFAFAFGNFLLVYLTVLSSREVKNGQLILNALFIPIYWLMMSMAAYKGLWQMVVTPAFWEKTMHGLQSNDEPNVERSDSVGAGRSEP